MPISILICSLAFCARLQESPVGWQISWVFSLARLLLLLPFSIHISIFNWCRGMEHIPCSSFTVKLYAETETLVTLWLFRALLSVTMLPGKKQVASLHADFLVLATVYMPCTGCVFPVYIVPVWLFVLCLHSIHSPDPCICVPLLLLLLAVFASAPCI